MSDITTYDNAPASETPDWTPCAGNRCCCGDTEQPCCSRCTPPVAVGSREFTYPVAYYGD